MTVMEQKKGLLSTLWVFLSLNYILCDLISNMEPSVVRGLLEGSIAGIPINETMLLIVALSLEIPIAMVVLSKILPRKSNRVINVIAAVLMIVYQLGSFAVDSDSAMHYIFFSLIEVIGNIVIITIALRWKEEM